MEAIEKYLQDFPPQKSCYDLAKELGIIGSADNLPSDLSTNKDYFQGFGE